MREIALTRGQVALVSDDDYESLSEHKWHAHKDPKNGNYYAVRNVKSPNGKRRTDYMHVVVASNCKIDTSIHIDHVDGNSLNNRRDNLRKATVVENRRNSRKLLVNSMSEFKGVTYSKKYKKWQAAIGCNYKRTWLGYFDDPVSAAVAYDKKAIELFGEFAHTNFPLGATC